MSTSFRNYIEEVRELNPILDVIRDYIPIDNSHSGRCPFHDDHSPSLSITPEKGLWHCFACQTGGDVFKFVEMKEGGTFSEALNLLAKRAGIKPFIHSPEMMQEIEMDQRIQKTRWAAIIYYHFKLITSIDEMSYVNGRGITNDLILSEKIGLAAGGLTAHLLDELNFTELECLESGLVKRTRTGHLKDYFECNFCKRIIIPNIRRGRIIHATGRALGEVPDSIPRYKHIEGPLELWGVDSTRGKDHVVLVEGVFDALSLMAWNIPTIALVGVNLKDEYDEGI